MSTPDTSKPLWTCPKCGAKLVSPNMWHACGPYSVEKFLEGKGTRAHEMFQRFADLIQKCGPVTTAPAKTRLAFMVRVRFAGVSSISERGMTIGFALRRPLKNPRIRKVVKFNPRWYGHTMCELSRSKSLTKNYSDGCARLMKLESKNLNR